MRPMPTDLLPWFQYGGSALAYTAFVLRGELPPRGSGILSKRNKRPVTSMITMHVAMLAVLLYSVHMATAIFPFLPNWLTVQMSVRGHITLFELILVLTFAGIAELEHRWLYVEVEDAASASADGRNR